MRVAGIPQLRHAALGEVVDVAGPDLAHPGVPRSIAVGEKGDELPVARNGGVMLRSLEIRQPRDRRAFERIPPEVLRALQLPRRRACDDQQTRTRRGPPGESGRTAPLQAIGLARSEPPRPRQQGHRALPRFRGARRRCRANGASDPSRDSVGAVGGCSAASAQAARSSRARVRGSPRSCRRSSRRRNAGRPVSISYSTQPNAQMSVRLSTAFPRACSGLM